MRSERPQVFLLPGIGGDEQPLADFRAALAARVDFELLDYPDIDRPSDEIRDFAGIVSRTVENIRRLKPSGNVHIVGYSFGGQVAFAAACRLQKEGRRVGLLALLDSRALSLKIPGSDKRVTNRDEPMNTTMAGADVASRLLIAAGLPEVVRAAIRPAGKLMGAGAAFGLRRLLLQNLRGRSLRGLSVGHFDGPLLLFRAQEQLVPNLPADLGWSPHCASVHAVELRGGHNSLFRADHLAENAELIWSKIDERIADQRR